MINVYDKIYSIRKILKEPIVKITAKQLAEQLGLSAAAVSMALNSKPGVSTETRARIIKAAEKAGYDFSRISSKKILSGDVYCVIYHSRNAILKYTPIFSELTDGIEQECRKNQLHLKTLQVYEDTDDISLVLEDLRASGCIGMILLGTEMNEDVCRKFLELKVPVILLDSYFASLPCTSVLINNIQGSYIATSYLISQTNQQPGHLKSSYRINNFIDRRRGFEQAVRDHGYSTGNSIVHYLSPTIEGAMTDMLQIIDSGTKLADCYFADNDLIAIGAIKALKLRNYKVPEDISIIGFDNIREGRVIDPSLTTVDIPRKYMGETALFALLREINRKISYTSKIEISTKIVKRFSA